MLGVLGYDHSCSRSFNTFLLNHRQVKYLTPIFLRLPKKEDVIKCTEKCTIELFPQVNKIPLRFIQMQL